MELVSITYFPLFAFIYVWINKGPWNSVSWGVAASLISSQWFQALITCMGSTWLLPPGKCTHIRRPKMDCIPILGHSQRYSFDKDVFLFQLFYVFLFCSPKINLFRFLEKSSWAKGVELRPWTFQWDLTLYLLTSALIVLAHNDWVALALIVKK